MRKIALGLGVAASAIAAPALARDGQTYFGADVGVVFTNEYDADVGTIANAVTTENDPGWEVAALLGHDFGPIRTELEGSYKEFSPEQYTSLVAGLPRGTAPPATGVITGFGETRFTSVMLNTLLDFGGEDGVGFSVGLGAGHTWAGFDLSSTAANNAVWLDDEAHDWAWQALAQLRIPVNENAELGLKYKYFDASGLAVEDTLGRDVELGVATHSALLSLIYNFGGAEAPPPPPPAPPPKL
jgi:OmpA-OmpF porin, OOP family